MNTNKPKIPNLKRFKLNKIKNNLKQKKRPTPSRGFVRIGKAPTKTHRKRFRTKQTKRKIPATDFQISKILLALGDLKSKKTLEVAIYFAKELNATITIFKVIPSVPLASASTIKKIKNEMKREVLKTLELARRYCLRKNVQANIRIGVGDEASAIVKASMGCDMIIVGSHGKGITEEIFFGSVSNKVAHDSKLPVLMVKFT